MTGHCLHQWEGYLSDRTLSSPVGGYVSDRTLSSPVTVLLLQPYLMQPCDIDIIGLRASLYHAMLNLQCCHTCAEKSIMTVFAVLTMQFKTPVTCYVYYSCQVKWLYPVYYCCVTKLCL